MLHTQQTGSDGPLIVMPHWLGGSSLSWRAVSQGLAKNGFRCVSIDLPGFGDEAKQVNFSVTETIRLVVATIRNLRDEDRDKPWMLAGHSMGGKFAMIIARMAADGAEGLEDLAGIVLVSPSPPGPEPMPQAKRVDLAKSLGPAEKDPAQRRENAARFIAKNTGRLPLSSEVKEVAIADVVRMNPNALMSWLEEGSREDWSSTVGQLTTPALVLAGSEDEALGGEAQHEHTLPHLGHATLVNLRGGGHLAPMERPAELIDRIVEFCRNVGFLSLPINAALGSATLNLIESEQTSVRTREVLMKRLRDSGNSEIFSTEEARTLRALISRVVPDAGFDLARRIEVMLTTSVHDGWRFNRLPTDDQAWKRGLSSLDLASSREFGVPFVALDFAQQDDLLTRALKGDLGRGLFGSMHIREDSTAFDADQMRDWFEDVRGELAKFYVSDPRTMERIGFTGFADESGFTQIRLEDHKGSRL